MDNNSLSGHSDIESSAEPEYHVTPAIWLENEEGGNSTEHLRSVVNGDLTLHNARFYNNLYERSWQNLRKSRIENDEQWNLFDNDVSGHPETSRHARGG